MFNFEAVQSRFIKNESGNAVIIVLVVLVVVAVGALAYLSGQMSDDQKTQTGASGQYAQNSGQAGTEQAENQFVVKPGNPVVAKVNGDEITRVDVFNLIKNLPPNARQMPVQQLFPVALDEVINGRLIEKKASGVNLDNDPEVKKQLKAAKENIVRTVFLQNEIEKRITEERLKEAYEAYKMNFPKAEEVKAAHILVKEESEAKDIVKQLEGGADFAALAKEKSVDGTAQNGGSLGYFLKTDVVPEFAEAAFGAEIGTYTTKPVQSEYGYHIIKVEDKRMRQPPEFEQAKPFLESQLRRIALTELVTEWRNTAAIERFDINGDKIEPAAGDETAPAQGQ